jgi:hypothetical protein
MLKGLSFRASLTLAMMFASWPREIVNPPMSRMNLRTVEYDAWQTPLR